jgi:mannose-6-phosphate isomerase
VHPKAARARMSFFDASAGHTYLDPYHKPELLVARTRFEVLCGFDEPTEVAEELARLNLPALADVVGHLNVGDIRAALATVLGWTRHTCRAVLHDAVTARDALSPERADLILRLAAVHPDDPGVFAAMMLRRYLLEPGEAAYVAPGQVHSYVHGAGVEIMASSDNVVRGGLTPKHVDVTELLTVATLDAAADPRVRPVRESDTTVIWPAPVDDFKLRLVSHRGPAETTIAPNGPRILLCVSGAYEVSDATGLVPLQPGTAAFSAAGDGEIRLRGDGEVFVASI